MSTRAKAFALAALTPLAALGCGKSQPRLLCEANESRRAPDQFEAQLAVHTAPDVRVKIAEFGVERQATSQGWAMIDVPMMRYALGPHTVEVTVERDGDTVTCSGSFERRVVPAFARIVTAGDARSGTPFTCRGPCGKQLVLDDDFRSHVVADGYRGVKVSLAKSEGVIGEDGKAPLDVDFTAAVASAEVGGDLSVTLKLPLALVAPEGGAAEPSMTLVGDLCPWIARRLTASGTAFPGDEPAPKRRRGLLRRASNGACTLRGTVARLSDIDLVATESDKEESAGTCGLYSGTVVNKTRRVKSVLVSERRTGEKVAERRFQGSARSCPDVVSYTVGSEPVVHGDPVDDAALGDWLASLLSAK